MGSKLTPWFPPEVLPVRPGVYELDAADSDGRCFCYFGGKHWGGAIWEKLCFGRGAIWRAEQRKTSAAILGGMARWRGLAEPPA